MGHKEFDGLAYRTSDFLKNFHQIFYFKDSPWKRIPYGSSAPDSGYVPRGYKRGGNIELKNVNPILGHSYSKWRYCEPKTEYSNPKRSGVDPVTVFNSLKHEQEMHIKND